MAVAHQFELRGLLDGKLTQGVLRLRDERCVTHYGARSK